MNNKIQKRPHGKASKTKKYDVFISYRRLSSTDFDHRHSTSLARSVAQAFESKGFKVFFDCWQGTQACLEELRKSKYFIILVTKYSFEKGGGEGYKQEIEEIMKSQAVNKDKTFLFNVDQSYESVHKLKEDFQEFVGGNLDAEVIPFSTKSDFTTTINHLIKPEHGSKIAIKKFPRFSLDFCKAALPICALLALLALSFGIRQQKHCDDTKKQLETCNNQLKQYEDSCIIFAGGGTVQHYLNDKNNIDVNNYQDYPSKYIHLPSKDAWSLLWDDVNENANRQYCPIVLSAGEIVVDSTNININAFKGGSDRRIVKYKIGDAPLAIQVFELKSTIKINDTLCLKELQTLLEETDNIYTTTSSSGTFFTYKHILDSCGFDLDKAIEEKGGKNYFNRKCRNDKKGMQVYLANDYYYYENAGKRIKIVSDRKFPQIITIPLFVYSIAKKGDSSDRYNILPEAKRFLDSIGCNTDTIITDKSEIVFTLDKRKH